jgi:hypothetical protein
MTRWWEIATEDPTAAARLRAVAYYRHSAQDRQENSSPIQREQVRDQPPGQFPQRWSVRRSDTSTRSFWDNGSPACTLPRRRWPRKRGARQRMQKFLEVAAGLAKLNSGVDVDRVHGGCTRDTSVEIRFYGEEP